MRAQAACNGSPARHRSWRVVAALRSRPTAQGNREVWDKPRSVGCHSPKAMHHGYRRGTKAGGLSLRSERNAARIALLPSVAACSKLLDPQFLGHGEGDVFRPPFQLALACRAPGLQLADYATHQHLRRRGAGGDADAGNAVEPLALEVFV